MKFMGNKPDTISNLKEKYKDGDVMAFAKKAEELSKDTRFINYYNIEEMHEAEKQDFYNTGREDGVKEGIVKGKLEGEHYNVPIRVDTIRRRYPIKWTCQEGIGTLIVNTKIWVF